VNIDSTTALVNRDDITISQDHVVLASFLASYREPTRVGYALTLRQWFDWCHQRGMRPLAAQRAHIELWARELEEVRGLMASTVAGKLNAVCGFYRYASIDRYLDHNPAEHVRRPPVPRESRREAPTRAEMLRMIDYTERSYRTADFLLIGILGLTGMRIGEACALRLEEITTIQARPCFKVHREKGNDQGHIPIPHRVRPTIEGMAHRDRTGPILKMRHGEPMDRKAAARIVTRVAKAVGVTKHLTPHSFRHFFITAALDAGVPPREIQHSMGYADIRPVSHYDRFDANPARHASNAVEAMVEVA
jgi:integrase/recombinase XerD